MKTTMLNNEISMPQIGYGVFRMTDEAECEEAVVQAIKCGYRMIDTAAAYGNEKAVGRALNRCGVPREELFISTKLWITDTSYEGAKRGFARSMDNLGLDCIDLYLIHQPYNDVYGAWRALEELYEQGKIRAIGVDNFTSDRLADFIYFNKTIPAANMVECNPFYQREDERKYMVSKQVKMLAWSPLAAGKSDLLNNETICLIAERHGASPAQIALCWLIQRGIVPIVKSANPIRMEENLKALDMILTNEEMALISSLDTGHTCFSPRRDGISVENFLDSAINYKL